MKIRSRFAVLPVALALTAGLFLTPTASAGVPADFSTQATKSVTLQPPKPLGSNWRFIAKMTYGTTTNTLSTSPGGEGMNWGPSYGTQVPNKTWWYADAAKLRLAHFSDSGVYLGQAKLPTKYLHQGVYFQWQNPQALANGTVVMTSTTIDSPALLKYRNGKFTKVKMSRLVGVMINDGRYLYGFDEFNKMVRVNPTTGKVSATSWFVGQRGRKFKVTVGTSYLKVIRPGATVRINLKSAAHPTLPLYPAIQVAMGADGKLWLLVSGMVELPEFNTEYTVGLLSVSRTGKVSKVYSMRNTSSDSDPGDGYNLGIRKGGTHPWMMFIDTDAVRVHRLK